MQDFLYEAYRGELFGIAFFNAFAEQARTEAEREKWQCLMALERHTADLLKSWLEKNGKPCQEPDPHMQTKGIKTAAPWLNLEWDALMATLEPWIEKYARQYREAVAEAPQGQQRIYEITAAHEEAILAFVQAENAGKADSLKAVRDFIAENQSV